MLEVEIGDLIVELCLVMVGVVSFIVEFDYMVELFGKVVDLVL